jgi:hypothetical protein
MLYLVDKLINPKGGKSRIFSSQRIVKCEGVELYSLNVDIKIGANCRKDIEIW